MEEQPSADPHGRQERPDPPIKSALADPQVCGGLCAGQEGRVHPRYLPVWSAEALR